MAKIQLIIGEIQFKHPDAHIKKVYSINYCDSTEQAFLIGDATPYDFIVPSVFKGEITIEPSQPPVTFGGDTEKWMQAFHMFAVALNIDGTMEGIEAELNNMPLHDNRMEISFHLARKFSEEFVSRNPKKKVTMEAVLDFLEEKNDRFFGWEKPLSQVFKSL